MRYQELIERVLNLGDNRVEDRLTVGPQIWNMLDNAYRDIGGFLSAANIEELASTPGLWKIVMRNQQVTAVVIYKAIHGRKLIGCATNGTPQGKTDLMMILQEDRHLSRSWAEVSGKMESLYRKMGALPISNADAHLLTGKHIMNTDEDGVHYTRLIAGHPHVKSLYGTPTVKLSPRPTS